MDLRLEVDRVKLRVALISLLVLTPCTGGAFQKGMSLTSYWHDQYSYPESDTALVDLFETNTEWISLLATWYQDSVKSTNIYRDRFQTPDDSSLIYIIERAHELGLKVMLKPHVDIQDDTWRALIEFEREKDWNDWFSSYTAFITYYAQLAQEHGVEQFCIGCEMTGTIHRQSNWEDVIDSIRACYEGPLTYAANWYPAYDSVTFWHALDFVGVDAYFGLTESSDPTVGELLDAWEHWIEDLEDFHSRIGKPIVITEIGYRSIDGCNITPWDWWSLGTIDLEEQADCYTAACSTFLFKDWLEGFYFWSWEVDRIGGVEDDSYTPRAKPAEAILRDWYGRDSQPGLADIPVQRAEDLTLHTFPVPFTEHSVIRCKPGTLRIYDSAGRLVRTIVTEESVCRWDGTDMHGRQVNSGVYIYRMDDRMIKTVYIAR